MPRSTMLLLCALAAGGASASMNLSAPLDCAYLCQTARDGMNLAKAGGCARERKSMPRPKIGNACGDGFVAGFNDACAAACAGDSPAKNQGLACGRFRNELPKPTTMKGCNTGYGKGFKHAVDEMKAAREAAAAAPAHAHAQEEAAAEAAIEHFEETAAADARDELAATDYEETAADEPAAAETPVEAPAEEAAAAAAPAEPEQPPAAAEAEPPAEEGEEPAAALPAVLFAMNVTVDDAPVPLEVFDGDDPEEAVAAFCGEHMAGAGESCAKQLLPHVTKKLGELEFAAAAGVVS